MVTQGTVGAALLGALVVTQVAYFLVNLGVVRLALNGRRETSQTAVEEHPPLEILLPAYREDRSVLEETFDSIAATDYPNERIRVHLIYDAEDETTRGFARSLADAYRDRFAVQRTVVQPDHEVWNRIEGLWQTSSGRLSRNKARALTYALYVDADGGIVQGRRPDGSLDRKQSRFPLHGVVTVLDSDTGVPDDLFSLGVSGLQSDGYDIVQAKQTVRNHRDGILPLWESMGITAWSHLVYARTSGYPYQLLGKGYFLSPETLYDVFGWDPSETTEDMALGLDAYAKGYELGIIDRYVRDLCPARWRDWVAQKRRWVTGPYRGLRRSGLSWRDRLRFASYTVANQSLPLVNLVGIPAGAYAIYLSVFGGGMSLPTSLWAVVTFNLVVWAVYTVGTYRSTRRAVEFETGRERLRYYLLSNPLTQVLYATLWSVPILRGLVDGVADRDVAFRVTPKTERPPE